MLLTEASARMHAGGKETTYNTQSRDRIGSADFRLEYATATPEAVLYHDIVSYLGEYRLQVPQYQYELLFTKGSEGQIRLRDQDQGEPMVVKAHRAIIDRQEDGRSVKKVTADLLGLQKMEEQLQEAAHGEILVYGSPPDPEAGYTYGFMYIGRVEGLDMGEKKLHMRAIRLDDDPTLIQYSEAISLLTEKKVSFSSPNEAVANPVMGKGVEDIYIDFVLGGVFGYSLDKSKQQQFIDIIEHMHGFIQQFISLIQTSDSPEERLQAFYALENYALQLKHEYTLSQRRSVVSESVLLVHPASFRDYMKRNSHKPPKAAGSCSDADIVTGNFFSEGLGTLNISYQLPKGDRINSSSGGGGSEEMKCVKCPFCKDTVDAIVTPGSIECPSCHASVVR